jgi:selenocysteine lyase/cysteine desulfurase
VYSSYKVYGPHLAALYGAGDAVRELEGPNHFFIPRDEVPYKFEPGGVSHEACAGVLALGRYLEWLATLRGSAGEETGRRDHDGQRGTDPLPDRTDRTRESRTRETLREAFDLMTRCEREPQNRLLEYLSGHPEWHLVGPTMERPRVGTVSFVHRRESAAAVVRRFDDADIAIRHGHMYAFRLCRAVGLDPADGVVRISLVHYNTPGEVDRAIDLLRGV